MFGIHSSLERSYALEFRFTFGGRLISTLVLTQLCCKWQGFCNPTKGKNHEKTDTTKFAWKCYSWTAEHVSFHGPAFLRAWEHRQSASVATRRRPEARLAEWSNERIRELINRWNNNISKSCMNSLMNQLIESSIKKSSNKQLKQIKRI